MPMTNNSNKNNKEHKNTGNNYVIINADDFGITKGVNKAINELVEVGVVTSTTVMTNMPYCEDIATLVNKIGIGIHFNLTTGKPLTHPKRIPSLVTEEGSFLDLPVLLERMKRKQISEKEVSIELDAQIEKLINIGVNIDHMDSHESILKYPFFMKTMKVLAQKYGIPAVRTYSPRKFDYSRLLSPKKILISLYLAYQKARWKYYGFKVADNYDGLLKMGLDYPAALKKLGDIFNKLPGGVLEIGVHPGYCNNNTRDLGGYVNEREVELQALMSKELMNAIEKSGARLIMFGDIK